MPPTSEDDFTSPSKNQCSQSKCKALLPVGCKYKTCDKCRNVSKLSMQKKRKRDKHDEDPHHQQAPAPGNSNTTEKGPVEYIYVGSEMESASDESKENTPVRFKDNHTIMTQLQKVFKTTERIFFCGSYDAPVDPLISYKDLAWAVKQMYSLCVHHDLPNLWAYLWENWYRRGRWELWVRSGEPREIPRLKTMMFVEGHWRRVKEDYFQHFSLPRVDLLAWVLVTKLAPTYCRKLDVVLNNIGRFCELPRWRRDFKFEWNKATRTPITMPLNEKYKPDVNRFHLVQRFQPVNPRFFLEVTQNRCPPFWSHPSLKPLPSEEGSEPGHPVAGGSDGDDKADSDNDDDALIDMENGREFEGETYKEEMEKHIHLIRDFCDGLKFQIKFRDPRFLRTLEREGAGFLRLAQNCLSRERRMNSSRAASLSTWERTTTNALFYRPRSRHGGT
ncbi:hypothetical protein EDB86DRAFT_2803978 [Lactarius hatsudake]|nr:hypothetical protein EDB86DRAFT_2803978 [Lactarius hatsudake]